MRLSWVDNSGGVAASSVERRAEGDTAFAPLATLPPGAASYADATVVPGTTYCYRVRSYDDSGVSDYSNEACDSARPLTASFSNPQNNAVVSGAATVSVTADGGTAPYIYSVMADGVILYSGSSPTFSWNTTAAPNGSRALTATVTDSSATPESTTASMSVTVSNAAAIPVPDAPSAPNADPPGRIVYPYWEMPSP